MRAAAENQAFVDTNIDDYRGSCPFYIMLSPFSFLFFFSHFFGGRHESWCVSICKINLSESQTEILNICRSSVQRKM